MKAQEVLSIIREIFKFNFLAAEGIMSMKRRKVCFKRKTKETSIAVELNLDGSGRQYISTGMPFLNHMLELFSRHSLIDLSVKAKGDLAVDYHHTVEDIGICLGTALDRALGKRTGIARYGSAYVPMDEALSRVVIDLGGRPCLVFSSVTKQRRILDFDLNLIKEFLSAFSTNARFNLHVAQLYGRNAHHAYESIFKAMARAMRMAVALDSREKGIPSSKGRL